MNSVENTKYMEDLLLQALRQDDEKALSYLFSTYYNKLFRMGIRLSADAHLSEECIQEVFQDLWQYRRTLGQIQSFEAYLKGSFKKRLFRHKSKNEDYLDANAFESIVSISSYESLIIEQEENDSLKKRLRQALDELSPRQKELIILKYFEELSYHEIATKTGLQVDSIYKTLHEGIKKLKNILSINA